MAYPEDLIPKRKIDFLREIQAVKDLALRVKKESIYQREPLYKEFKAKTDGRSLEILNFISLLTDVFKFYQESSYWCHKFLSDRVCNKVETTLILDMNSNFNVPYLWIYNATINYRGLVSRFPLRLD